MSAIHKLSIQGIRSFDSNDRETIEFGTPLTLIVGMNGSGKTTIIECLKYATTGDLPPNSKGGVFVHDPKITGEKDIRAQVKLAFASANGLNMIVTRNIQLLAKKTTNTFKTLEGQLVVINKSGDRTTLSTKSVELDTQVPLYMGVPTAILDYVIFCHQEDSLWPLSEPSNLKKKFDEIFQAMKFTKAIDNLKAIKKDMVVDIKLLKQSVGHLKVERDRSKSTKMTIHQLEAKIDEFQNEVNKIEERINQVTTESDRIYQSNQEFQNVLTKFENLKAVQDVTSNEISRLTSNIELIDMSKDQITEMLKNFGLTLEEKEKQIKIYEKDLYSMEEKQYKFNEKRDTLIRKEAELSSLKSDFSKRREKLTNDVEIICMKYDFDVECADLSISEGYPIMEEELNRLRSYSEGYNRDAKENLKLLENNLKTAQYNETTQTQKLNYSKEDVHKLSKEIEILTNQLSSMETSEDELNKSTQLLSEYNKKLQDWENNDASEEIASKLKNANDKILLTEKEVENIQDKISRTNQQSDLFAKLSVIKENIAGKQTILNSLNSTLESDPKMKEFGLTISDDVDMDFKRFFINLQKNIAVSNKELTDTQKQYNETLFQLNSLEKDMNENLNAKNVLFKKLTEQLPEDCQIDDYDDIVLEAEMSYKTALENLKMHQTTLQFNKKALEIADRDDCCYLCSRKFETGEFKSKLLMELRKKTDSNFEKTLEQTVDEEKQYLTELRSLDKDIIAVKNYKKKNEQLQSLKEAETDKHTKLQKDLTLVETKNKDLKDSREYCEKTLRRNIEQFTDISKELDGLKSEYAEILNQLKVYSDETGNIQTVNELQDLQKSKNESMRQLRSEINMLQVEREEKSREYSDILSKINETNLHIKDLEKSIISAKNLKSDIDNKKNEISDINDRIKKLEVEVQHLVEEKRLAENTLFVKQDAIQKKTVEISTRLNDLKHDYDAFMSEYDKITKFETWGIEELESCHKSIAAIESDIEENTSHLQSTTRILNEQREKLRDSNNEKRALNDNLELIKLKEKYASVEKEMTKIDIEGAEAQKEKYKEESTRLRSLYEQLSSDNAGRMGEIKQLQNQINSLTHQLRSDYKDIDDKYHKEWVKLQTKTFVTDDIDTYSKALDSAIMRYHSLKMEDINRIIDELWKKTYSGTDIDTIKIRSDEVKSTVKGKSYNYRVVMFKQDAELDMRGRCSAGQKVLASIIIRLALSETFGTNCGVIALDEPTTNLDEENIESLAKSLHNIIDFRKHQKNFQLIVITHDEKFLTHMDASQFTDHFFKVKRDDRQKSQIEWVDISKVSEY